MDERTKKLMEDAKNAVAKAVSGLERADTPEAMVDALKKLVFVAIPLEHGIFLLTGPNPDVDDAAKYVLKSLERTNDGQKTN